jgi:hypothetical protein
LLDRGGQQCGARYSVTPHLKVVLDMRAEFLHTTDAPSDDESNKRHCDDCGHDLTGAMRMDEAGKSAR